MEHSIGLQDIDPSTVGERGTFYIHVTHANRACISTAIEQVQDSFQAMVHGEIRVQ